MAAKKPTKKAAPKKAAAKSHPAVLKADAGQTLIASGFPASIKLGDLGDAKVVIVNQYVQTDHSTMRMIGDTPLPVEPAEPIEIPIPQVDDVYIQEYFIVFDEIGSLARNPSHPTYPEAIQRQPSNNWRFVVNLSAAAKSKLAGGGKVRFQEVVIKTNGDEERKWYAMEEAP